MLRLACSVIIIYFFIFKWEYNENIIMNQDDDAIFRLSLEDNGVVTTCDIVTLYMEDFDEVN